MRVRDQNRLSCSRQEVPMRLPRRIESLYLFAPLFCAVTLAAAASTDDQLRAQASSLFGRIQVPNAVLTPETELGRALFWDVRVSSDGKTACASCHPAKDYGADARRFSPDAR